MKTCHRLFSSRWSGAFASVLCLALNEAPLHATQYNWILDTGTSNWTTVGNWSPTPPANGPVILDDIDMQLNTGTGTTVTSLAGNRSANSLTKTGSKRWDIAGNGATLSTLTLNSITIGTANMIFRDGSGAGGLQVNVGNITVTAGSLFFGSTSLSASNLQRGLAVSGTTTVSGGALQINVDNPTDTYSLGLLNVSGAGDVRINNAPAGKGGSTANVTGLNGTGGVIQVAPNTGQNTNTATLAITNTADYSSATVLRDSATNSLFGVLTVSKAGSGTQTLTGANSYTGATLITNGILKLGNLTALGARAGTVASSTDNGTNVSATGTLDLGGQTGVIEVIRLNGTGMGGNGALINTGAAASIGNGVAAINQTTGGTAGAPVLTLSGGGGTGATATAAMGVTTTTFTINGGTTVYSVAPTVTISGGGATFQGTATAVLTGGVVTGITITGAGSGYTSAPTLAFSGGTVTTAGTNPTGTGNASNFTPINYTITATGGGFTSAPSVAFSTGPYAATASLSGIVLEGNSSIGGTGDITVDGVITESGGARSLTKVGTNTLVLTSSGNSYSGATIVNGGGVSIATDSALGNAPGAATPGQLTLNGGRLSTTADMTLNANRGISLGAAGGTLEVAAATTLGYAGSIADTGALTKNGTGTLALSGGSSYSGATVINAGVLAISNNTALGTTSGGVTVISGATLQLSGGITVGNEALTLTGDGAAAGAGALFNANGNNTWGGNIDVTAGATRINSDAGKLTITGDIAMNSTTGNFNVGGAGDVEISGVISGGLQFFKSSVGGGVVTLSNPSNTYTNHTTVAAGTLRISTEGNLGITPASFSSVKLRVRSGGTLQTTADMSISPNRGITVSNSGGALSPDTGTVLTVNSRISGVAGDVLSKTGGGTLVLAGDSTFAGGMTVSSGTLMVTNTSGSGTGSGAVNVVGGTLAGHHASTGNIAGPVTLGTGTALSPGGDPAQATHGIGTLKFTSVDVQSGSTGQFDILGSSSVDHITVSGNDGLVLNGNLSVTTSLTGPAFDSTFAVGAIFDLIDWVGLLGGTFNVGANLRDGSGDDAEQFDLPSLASVGRAWDVSQFLSNGTIIVSAVPEPSRTVMVALGLWIVGWRRRR